TGAGMMDCKKALVENNGDFEVAVDWLRKKGLSAAAKKSSRAASEGLVAIHVEGEEGVIVEVNAETDFVARNDKFQGFVRTLADIAIKGNGDVEALKAIEYNGSGHSVQDELVSLIATIGENMNIRRSAKISVNPGVIVGYMHNQLLPGLGKIGVLVALKSAGDAGKLQALGHQLAMHIAAARPESLNVDSLDAEMIARERKIHEDQASASGKPAEIVAKMVDGRMRKYFEEVVLLEQAFVIDPDKRVSQVVAEAAKDIGAPVEISAFVRFACGEGVEKREDDLAAEVAKTLGNA
ncbi:MAG TPA: elongation factor Ts, partial [Rhodospirillaceae bacterium]|nr:elongation factor Ts [Rhodospirillaceae bacterium]